MQSRSSYDISMYDSLHLSTTSSSFTTSSLLRPIELTHSIGSRWTTAKLERYSGWGQIASMDYKNATFVPGQMILFPHSNSSPSRAGGGKYSIEPSQFSFLWLPTKHHIVFSRPTLDEITTLTRDILSLEDEKSNIKEYIQQCFELDWNAKTSQDGRKEECVDDDIMEVYDQDVILLRNSNPFRRIPMVSELELLSTEECIQGNLNKTRFVLPTESKEKIPTSLGVLSFWAAKRFRTFMHSVSNSLKDLSSTKRENSESP